MDIYSPIKDQLQALNEQLKDSPDETLKTQTMLLEKGPSILSSMVEKYLELPQIKEASAQGKSGWNLREKLLEIREDIKDENITPIRIQEQFKKFQVSFNQFLESVKKEHGEAEKLQTEGKGRAKVIKLNAISPLGLDHADPINSKYESEDKASITQFSDQLTRIIEPEKTKMKGTPEAKAHENDLVIRHQKRQLMTIINKYLKLPEILSASKKGGKKMILKNALEEVRQKLTHFDPNTMKLSKLAEDTAAHLNEFILKVQEARKKEPDQIDQVKGKLKSILGMSNKADKVEELYRDTDSSALSILIRGTRITSSTDQPIGKLDRKPSISAAAQTTVNEPSVSSSNSEGADNRRESISSISEDPSDKEPSRGTRLGS